ncbi:hypothetical protein Nepgr_002471 [Nepenthes gracilis]|uniref:E3 ubiquitin protein ligase n=1 Tax=Nepenthes gracilis TaxID=150966 RepID=A0AAD3RWX6_NEPGR|nr:hypothetical protein Nepgr_002471 [Nepenthes gracilis]
MGSTGEADRKRRHLSSMSPTAAPAKKQPFAAISEDKKLDTAVLQYQNQKLCQKLEAQKIEIVALENKFCQQKEKQEQYGKTLTSVDKCWEKLVDDLESCSIRTRGLGSRVGDHQHSLVTEDGVSSSVDVAFIDRLTETYATECCSTNNSPDPMVEDGNNICEKSRNILRNIVAAVDDLWLLKDGLYVALSMAVPEDGSCRQKTSNDLVNEVKNLRSTLSNLHLKHKSLAKELRDGQDSNVKNKAAFKRLRGELEGTIRELEGSNQKVDALKAEKDATKGAFFPVFNLLSKHVAGDRVGDKQKDLQDIESTLKELTDQSSSRLQELKHLHEERIGTLKKLSNLQSTLKSVKCISSSQAFQSVRQQLEKYKVDVIHYQAIFEKLQVEKDTLAWREKEANVKSDLSDVYRRSCTVADSRINELGIEIRKQIDKRRRIEPKLEESLREPGRKEIISKFKAFVSSFPDDMSNMQSQLSKCKEAAADIHSLRADVQSLIIVVNRKAKELETLSSRCAEQEAEIRRLHAVVQDLKESDIELKLFLEMYRRESIVPRTVLEARESEYRAWANLQSLKSSLDEHNLELRVKAAIEAEAISQQRLAAAEAEIADQRQKWEASKRDMSKLSDILKSKHEENDAYLSEIETIGQAYDDMQNQNQHMLQQITERDDYNIKLVLEGTRNIQMHDVLLVEKHNLEKKVQQASTSQGIFEMKAIRIEEQVKMCSEQVHKLAEDRCQASVTLENTQRRMLDARKSSHQTRESLEEVQLKVKDSRANLAELQGELDRERFLKKRMQEDLEAVKVKAAHLREQREGSAVEKLHQELQGYREILKCSICLDRAKEVVITKCYHLFCNTCVQRIIEGRHRKCPVCAASFGPNDVKPVYI